MPASVLNKKSPPPALTAKYRLTPSCFILNCSIVSACTISASSHSPESNTPSIVGVLPSLAIGPVGSTSRVEEHAAKQTRNKHTIGKRRITMNLLLLGGYLRRPASVNDLEEPVPLDRGRRISTYRPRRSWAILLKESTCLSNSTERASRRALRR